MNQLQKDIETLLKIADKNPDLLTEFEYDAIDRLKWYVHEDIRIYCRIEMRALLESALATERTNIGKNVLKQLLNNIGEINELKLKNKQLENGIIKEVCR